MCLPHPSPPPGPCRDSQLIAMGKECKGLPNYEHAAETLLGCANWGAAFWAWTASAGQTGLCRVWRVCDSFTAPSSAPGALLCQKAVGGTFSLLGKGQQGRHLNALADLTLGGGSLGAAPVLIPDVNGPCPGARVSLRSPIMPSLTAWAACRGPSLGIARPKSSS